MTKEALVIIEEVRADGYQLELCVFTNVGRIFVMVGIPTRDLRNVKEEKVAMPADVWPLGDSLDAWCPDGLTAEQALDAARAPALRAWEAHRAATP